MNYYISDLHIAHENALRFDNRPYENIDQMNEAIIHNWNNTVLPGDTVYILGDFIWQKEALWCNWLDQLQGQMVLIRGNHDPKSFSQATKRHFQDITEYKEITDTGRHVIMCHYPIPFHKGTYDEKTFMLYGHVHNTREYTFLKELQQKIRCNCSEPHHARGQFINVGCMMPWMGYTPRTLDEIITGANHYQESQQLFCNE